MALHAKLAPVFEKGRKKTGGRQKGTKNKATLLKQQALEAAKLAELRAEMASREEIEHALARIPTLGPLDVLLMGMHLKLSRGDLDGAMQIAAAAAPYTSPKLSATDMNIRHNVSSRSDAELSAEIAALRAKVEQARSPPLIEAQAEVPGDQHADLQYPAGPLS